MLLENLSSARAQFSFPFFLLGLQPKPDQPAACSLPVLVGPSQFNFASICVQLEAAVALLTVKDTADLTDQLRLLLADPERGKRMGDAGKQLILANRTALPQVEDKIAALLELAG